MGKQQVKVEDLFKIRSVTNPKLSPDGKTALFIQTEMKEESNTYEANLFHIDLETRNSTQWTYGAQRVSSPAWSKDGTQVAFLSNRDETNQLYVMSAAGGEARKVTSLANGVSSFLWSPCGNKIWIQASVQTGKTFMDQEKPDDVKKPQPVRVTKMKYKADGIGVMPEGSFNQIGVIDVETEEITTFTEGDYDHTLHAVSPDGKQLVMGVNRCTNLDYEFKEPLYIVDVDSKKETVLIEEDGVYGGVHYSFDGRYIAFTGANREFENMTHDDVFVYEMATGLTVNLAEGLDMPGGDHAVADIQQGEAPPAAVWTKDHHLYFQMSSMGDVQLYFASLDGALYPATPQEEHVYDYDIAQNGEFALVCVSTAVSPGELYKHHIATGDREKLTSVNQKYVDETELVMPEQISFAGGGGMQVHGWLMKPAGYIEGEKYPLILEIHGGPQAMFANSFFHEMQLLAAQGYGVLYINPRGSHGYSQAFVNAVRGDYGGEDYKDFMAAVDFVLDQYDWIDSDRLGVTGGSYGGFMTNWIVGHTDRFKAAVTQRSISNWISFFGVSDIGYFFNDWQLGINMNDVDQLWAHSPLKYAKNVQTPLLILHAENDFRCPIEQAEQLFITLKSFGKKTEFVRFPEGDHNMSREGLPNMRIARLKEIVGWFAKYIDGDSK